jgi:hypothetical protein
MLTGLFAVEAAVIHRRVALCAMALSAPISTRTRNTVLNMHLPRSIGPRSQRLPDRRPRERPRRGPSRGLDAWRRFVIETALALVLIALAAHIGLVADPAVAVVAVTTLTTRILAIVRGPGAARALISDLERLIACFRDKRK